MATDIVAPQLTSLTRPQGIDVTRGSAIYAVAAGATDEGDGVAFVYVTLDRDFRTPSGTIAAEWTIQGIGDVNGDGRADLVWRDTAGHVNVWTVDTDHITSAPNVGTIGAEWMMVA